jgi:hypothetical protein
MPLLAVSHARMENGAGGFSRSRKEFPEWTVFNGVFT